MIKILLGGSPCTYWSIAQTNNRETTAEGQGWELFKNYLIAKEKFNPDIFLYENNKSAAQAIKNQIKKELNVDDINNHYIEINSALVSAQNRQRFYVHNCPNVEQPKDRGILLSDVLEQQLSTNNINPINITKDGKSQTLKAQYSKNNVSNFCGYSSTYGATGVAESIPINTRKGKSGTIRATCYKDGIRNLVANNYDKRTCVAIPIKVGEVGNGGQGNRIYSVNGKAVSQTATSGGLGSNTGLYAIPSCDLEKTTPQIYEVNNNQISVKDKQYPIKLDNGFYAIRKLTPIECERLQTMPDNYTEGVSNAQRYKALGNGWTAEVIIHILSHALINTPKDEEIVVLSMYDGIATGRYVLDKLGFTNVTYYAYEIDKYAIQIAQKNYPDIIQCGDAFELRDDNWRLKNDNK